MAAGTTVSGAMAGIYVANAGRGADGVLKQSVTVDGTVRGGTDAAVHLVGGGRLMVGKMGRVLAGSSGVAVLVNEPGPAHLTIDGVVRGGRGGAAAVHLTGGGTVVVGTSGRVEANGATWAIQGGGTDSSRGGVTLTYQLPPPAAPGTGETPTWPWRGWKATLVLVSPRVSWIPTDSV